MIYFAYNACAEDARVGPFAAFAQSTLAFADAHPIDRFVIDLRRNGGGNSELIRPLIDGLAARPALAGRVFAIIGMHTFSSAMIDAMELSRRVHARLVGGPTSGKPSGYGEIKTFTLPISEAWSYPVLDQAVLEPGLSRRCSGRPRPRVTVTSARVSSPVAIRHSMRSERRPSRSTTNAYFFFGLGASAGAGFAPPPPAFGASGAGISGVGVLGVLPPAHAK